MFSCPFAHLVIFDRMPDIVNFTLLGAGYFCIPLNLELCSGIQLNYLETDRPFPIFLFYDLLGRSGTVLSRGLIIVHYKGRTCWRILPNSHMLLVFPVWLGEQNPSPALGEQQMHS